MRGLFLCSTAETARGILERRSVPDRRNFLSFNGPIRVTADDIRRAAEKISSAVAKTPLKESHHFSKRFGGRVFLKLENLQHTGSFKVRGALNKLLSLKPEECQGGVIAASAGNHAQGVAYQATRLGIKSSIVMPKSSPIVKMNATRDYGAEVILYGESYDEAFAHALEIQQKKGLVFVHPFEDPAIIAGQGSIGLELLEQYGELEQVIVPVGGGGLIAGIATALKAVKPSLRVIGVQAEGAPGMARAFKTGKVELVPVNTIADGIGVKQPSRRMLELLKGVVDEMVTVSEEAIANAILLLMERAKLVVEGSGAVGLAALLSEKVTTKGLSSALVISGGNIDFNKISLIIERGLMAEGRLIRFSFLLDDRPGALHHLTAVLAEEGANILEVNHNRLSPLVSMGKARVTLLLETKGKEHVIFLKRVLEEKGFQPTPQEI
ncbi:MAG: threonine ammonia-lyase [Deltaproteobacteria bacterium]|nr:threonine ammonia-lyase [Deltaproteobacteria bacterium]